MQPGSPARDRQRMAWMADLERLTAAAREPARTCGGCHRFQPCKVNPTAAMGRCGAGRGLFYPMARTYCRQHEAASA